MSKLEEVFLNIEWPKNRPFQVVGLGRNAVDWICVLPNFPKNGGKIRMKDIHKSGGGEIATATALCAQYGMTVRYVGRLGDDEIGQFSLMDLKREPMDISCVDIVTGASSQIGVILVDGVTGERTVLWDVDPALLYQEGELKRNSIIEGQLLHVDGHDLQACLQAAKWAKEAQMKISLDIDKMQPGCEKLLELSDFVLATSEFICEVSGEKDWRKGLLAMGHLRLDVLGVTLGGRGAAVLHGGKIIEFPGLLVDVVDTTGAGDIFHGAFIYALFQEKSLNFCFRFANVAAGLACRHFGARPGIVPLKEVIAHL